MVMQPVMWQEEECRSGIVAHGRKMDCEQLLISSATSCACTAQVRDTWRPHLTHVTLVLMSHVHSRSRLDIDFTRLLSRCDRDAAVSSSPLSASGWRLERVSPCFPAHQPLTPGPPVHRKFGGQTGRAVQADHMSAG